jgi:hypothetical protein
MHGYKLKHFATNKKCLTSVNFDFCNNSSLKFKSTGERKIVKASSTLINAEIDEDACCLYVITSDIEIR